MSQVVNYTCDQCLEPIEGNRVLQVNVTDLGAQADVDADLCSLKCFLTWAKKLIADYGKHGDGKHGDTAILQ